MVAALDSFPMAATTYRPTFDDRCRRTSHWEASKSKKWGDPWGASLNQPG